MSILSVVGSLQCEYSDRCLCGLIDEYCDSCGPNHVMNINGRPLWSECDRMMSIEIDVCGPNDISHCEKWVWSE